MSELQKSALEKAQQELSLKKAVCAGDYLFFKGDISPETRGVLLNENALQFREIGGEKHPGTLTLLDDENRILAVGWMANSKVIKKIFPTIEIIHERDIHDLRTLLLSKDIAKPESQRLSRNGAMSL